MTKVIFRELDGEVIALFPTMPGNMSPDTCLSYQHIGQHGPATAGPLGKSADKEKYSPLLEELKGLGYTDLKIVKKFTRQDYKARESAIEREL